MTWIRTVPQSEADEKLLKALEAQRALYPKEYATPVQPTSDGTAGIVASRWRAMFGAYASSPSWRIASITVCSNSPNTLLRPTR
jgi:hypothetical protein